MNKESWLKFLRHSTEAHHIREIFNGTYSLLVLPKVQAQFLNRIDALLSTTNDAHTKKSLEDLKEDIELEIEHGALRKSGRPSPQKLSGRPFDKDQTPRTVKIMNAIEYIRDELDRLEQIVIELSEIHAKVNDETVITGKSWMEVRAHFEREERI